MLSITGMLGPSSPVSQRPSWYDYQSEKLSESGKSKTSEVDNMSLSQDHQGLQPLLGTATSSEPSSPEASFRSDSHMRSFSEEVCFVSTRVIERCCNIDVSGLDQVPTKNQFPRDRKRKASGVSGDDETNLSSRNRFAATSSPAPKKKRAPRPQYTKEQEDFIWFCRDDLSMSWRMVVELYNNHWHPFEVEPHIRSESGLQSRYYRILDFPIKVRKKKEPSRPDLGLLPSTDRRYSWMGVVAADIENHNNIERNARYNTASQRGVMATREERGVGVEDEGNSDNKIKGVKREPDCSEGAKQRSQHWNITEGTKISVLHTSETDSEVEPAREWKKSMSPHDYELKVPCTSPPTTGCVSKTTKF